MREITAFGSYAHDNQELADRLSRAIRTYFAGDSKFRLKEWRDVDLRVGEDWDAKIQAARAGADVQLHYLSPAYLASDYIREHEMPGEITIPIMLGQLDYERMNLREMKRLQIFSLGGVSYSRCGDRREEFEFNLYQQMHDRLVREFGDAR